jgi:hypothetical protein
MIRHGWVHRQCLHAQVAGFGPVTALRHLPEGMTGLEHSFGLKMIILARKQ